MNEETDCAAESTESAESLYAEPPVKESTPRQFEHSDSTGTAHQPPLKKNAMKPDGVKHFFTGVGNTAKQLWRDHKGEIVGGVITFLVTTIPAIIDAATSSGNSSKETPHPDDVRSDSSTDDKKSYAVDDDSYSSPHSDSRERSSPREHEVPWHSQRYHTKNGVEWRDKAPYPRGGKGKEE
ncbi:hypothetical protein [Intestinibacillus massiliensis]|uniref:hypothetical protein n=1 Tax=Intestinibacillus massiliensis TaxID=1871029 RepID=UPI00117A6A59|nr:hypothetical protein [Intestinibacillus massiliensis]